MESQSIIGIDTEAEDAASVDADVLGGSPRGVAIGNDSQVGVAGQGSTAGIAIGDGSTIGPTTEDLNKGRF